MGERMLDVANASKKLGVSEKTVRRMMQDGRIRSVDLNHGSGKRPCYRIPESSILGRITNPEGRESEKIVTR